ncbi:uncharacterized protein upSET [Prorops nasuta]|uniref:uncharacterized protein upSET n=1 Tax=Prorops nasuta TaxID=863751 RepID=UPI0034CD84B2
MSFVLQLGTVETPAVSTESPSVDRCGGQEPPKPIQTILTTVPNRIPTVVPEDPPLVKSQNPQTHDTELCNTQLAASAAQKSSSGNQTPGKIIRETQKVVTNTTQVLATRVVSQKVSNSGLQQQNNAVVPQVAQIPVKTAALHSPGGTVAHVYPMQGVVSPQSFTQTSKPVQSTSADATAAKQHTNNVATSIPSSVHQKLQPVSAQQILATASVKAITTATMTAMSNIHRFHVKTPVAGQSQTVNLQKMKTVTCMNQTGQRNSTQKIQSAQKSQVIATAVSAGQITNSGAQRVQQNVNSLAKTQINAGGQKVQQVYNHQKTPLLSNQLNHKQQFPTNQQTVQKLQVQNQKVGPQRQQGVVNNVQKHGNSVAGLQKTQVQNQQQVQTQRPPQQRPQGTLQKSQSLASVARPQTITNITKSNSVANLAKLQQGSNIITKQVVPQTQTVAQLQQQTNPNQRSHSVTNAHQKVATLPNNQRPQSSSNAKMQQSQQLQQQQQQMILRMGIPKNQSPNAQQGPLRGVSQKLANTVKSQSAPGNVQSPMHRNNNSQSMKIIQQPQQNILGPQSVQKQPGCIKTIPPQKTIQRNHTQKAPGIKTSLNTHITTLKAQTSTTPMQKTNIKTLLPQPTANMPHMLIHKNPVKIQQQTIQQKQLIVAPQYPQQVRPQGSGQIKTLLPVVNTEPRKDDNSMELEIKMLKDQDSQQSPKSPVRRMPLPYECLQFVLQDHNYGAPPPRTPPPPSPPPHPKQQPINGAGSSTPTPQNSFIYGQVPPSANIEDDAASAISSEPGREAEPEGEETETAPEGEGDDEDSVTRCICDFEHDDGYMICCDRCLVWQHVDCMGIDRSNIPEEYLCEICRPRRVDRQRARTLQMRKREELLNSDTSSDTSSTSSADTDPGVNSGQKKRPMTQVPRRKSESSQVRRLNNNNNNNNNTVSKRQRREPHPRQPSAVRKKEVTKRGPGKRKTKRRMSGEEKEDDVLDAWGSNMAPLRQWIERYEEAVTNHYSPELRARISSIKVNGTHGELRQSNMNAIATGKCRLNVHSNNLKFLVATMYLLPNTPVLELRGKYMLSTQHRPSHPQGRQHAQRPGPFVFFYRLPRDGTEVCVDTRTYGNDARFVRRSCKPNAEVKHCIEKGTLHLYIVTITAIEKNAEITIKHEQHDLLLSPNSNSATMPVICACNNPRECQFNNSAQLSRRGSNGALAENADGRERRRRGRRNTISEDNNETVTTVAAAATVTQTITTPPATITTGLPKKAVATTSVISTPRQASQPKEELPVMVPQAQTSPNPGQATPQESKKDKKKMTREERKMEAIMKAFERLEKAEQRKQEVQARNAQRKESGGTQSDIDEAVASAKPIKQQSTERVVRRKRRKGRARTTSQSQNRRSRLNSGDSDVSSGEESNSMQSPPLRSNRPPSRQYAHIQTPGKKPEGSSGISTDAGLLLALANSNAPGSSSPPLQQPTPAKSPTCDSGASSSSQSSTPSTPLSSACLLVAAAVGPLAPGFKFPKTKKVLMNEWLKESPDPPSTVPQVSPLPSNQNSINALCRPSELAVGSDPSAEFLSQSYAAKSLATLVQAAHSVSAICDSPPQRKQQSSSGSNACNVSSGSAKKRWLRQAISEECDSPRAESPPSEMIAPPKKRRIARESLSSDNYTPPTTPTMLVPDTNSNGRSLCSQEDDYVEAPQSPIQNHVTQNYQLDKIKIEKKDEQCTMAEASVKSEYGQEELKSEIKDESDFDVTSEEIAKKEPIKYEVDETEFVVKREAVQKFVEMEEGTGTVEIVDQNEPDTEMDDMSSPVATMESDAILKQRVAEMRLEFGGGIAEIVSIASENEKSDDDRKTDENSKLNIQKEYTNDSKSEDSLSIDEFDVEAQMKKITGDDGNDYKEKVDTSSEKDNKSMDGIEGLMDSSKEDSESEDKEIDDSNYEAPFKMFKVNHETSQEKDCEFSSSSFSKEIQECGDFIKKEGIVSSENSVSDTQTENTEQSLDINIENSSNMESLEPMEPQMIFQSIPPLSERIRKKTDTPAPKTKLDFEAAIIESTIDLADVEDVERSEQKSLLSTAFRELLEVKIEEEQSVEMKIINEPRKINTKDELERIERLEKIEVDKLDRIDNIVPIDVKTVALDKFVPSLQDLTRVNVTQPTVQNVTQESNPIKEEEPQKEFKRKDPRTVVPNNMPAPSPFKEVAPPVKRKVRTLSISEYRKRKQQSSGTPPEPEPTSDTNADKAARRGRSDSASSGTSSLSSDEEASKAAVNHDLPGLTALPLFTNNEAEEKKGGEEGTIGWSAAPTLVERQRENLTERLKREFGLFLSDDEEERARKQGLTAEAILKARKASPGQVPMSNPPPGYPLPPQPYIPPPGTSVIHYSQFQNKTCSQFPAYPATPATTSPTFSNTPVQSPSNKQTSPFLVPQTAQAPPGSNPYPPQFIPPTTTAAPPPKFKSATPPTVATSFQHPPQTQKTFFNHPSSRS